MSISSSMNAGVAGLAAQSNQLASISDNIANSSTHGYKRSTTDFYDMVIGNSPSRYVAGGVRTATSRLVDVQGALTGTSNATDLAVEGRGMLPITRSADVAAGGDLSFMMTTTGSFSPDKEGYLRTSSGLVLLGVPVDDTGAAPNFGRTTTDALEAVRIPMNEITASPTTTMAVAANLPAASTRAGAAGAVETQTVTYYDNLGAPQTLTFEFAPTVPATGASNEWTLTVTDEATGLVEGTYELTFDAASGGGGRLDTVTNVSGAAYSAATGLANLVLDGGQTIALDIGLPGEAGGFTQLAAKFTPGSVTRDGSGASSLTGVTVDESGYVVASYDSGDTRRLYQIPVVDVPNPNGLTALGNQTYAPSRDSGAFTLWDAGDGPTGTIQGFAREESTVDVAQELTQLIRTQRAYASNAKVIQTVDEMFQETTNIKR